MNETLPAANVSAHIYIADAGPIEVAIYPDPGDSAIARYRVPDTGEVDALLREHGWHRVGPWTTAEDVPPGHRLAMVERDPDPAIQQLIRDQEVGRERMQLFQEEEK